MNVKTLFAVAAAFSGLAVPACDNGTDLGHDGGGSGGSAPGGSSASSAGTATVGGNQPQAGNGGSGGSGASESGSGGNSAGAAGAPQAGGDTGGATLTEAGAGAGGSPDSLVGTVCEQGTDDCGPNLVCCYPCGIAGCEFMCLEPCSEGTPGCNGGCIAFP